MRTDTSDTATIACAIVDGKCIDCNYKNHCDLWNEEPTSKIPLVSSDGDVVGYVQD